MFARACVFSRRRSFGNMRAFSRRRKLQAAKSAMRAVFIANYISVCRSKAAFGISRIAAIVVIVRRR